MKLLKFLIFNIFISSFIFSQGSKANQTSFKFGLAPTIYQQTTEFASGGDVNLAANFPLYSGNMQIDVILPMVYIDNSSFLMPGQELVRQNLSGSAKSSALSFLANKKYLGAWLPDLYWVGSHIRIGLQSNTNEDKFFGSAHFILWGNPLYNPQAPYLGSSFSIQPQLTGIEAGLYTSSIIDPSFVMAYYQWQVDESSRRYFLREMSLTPLIWYDQVFAQDISGKHHGGGGFDLITGGYRSSLWAIGSELSFHAAYREQYQQNTLLSEKLNLWQSSLGLWLELLELKFSSGMYLQSESHPRGPYLSSLYPGRARVSLKNSTATITGLYVGMQTSEEYHWGVKGRASVFWANSVSGSFHLWLYYKDKPYNLQIGFIKEDFLNYTDINRHFEVDSFVSFEVSLPIIPDFLVFHWRSQQSWYDTSELGSKVWLNLVF